MVNDRLLCPTQQAWTVGVALPAGTVSVGLAPRNDLTPPFVYAVSGLPNGVSMSGSGVFSGTPVEVQSPSIVRVTVTDTNGVVEECAFEVLVADYIADDVSGADGISIHYQGPFCGAGSIGPIPTTNIAQLIAASTNAVTTAYP